MISKYYDKILLAIALAVLLGVFGYAAFRAEEQEQFLNIPALRPENTYVVSEMPELDLSIPRWQEPPPQSAGSEWIFDVFTPPQIHFNPRTETFIVQGPDRPPPGLWPIDLVSIREDDYRVQMTAYFGEAGDYIINLEDWHSGQSVLAREGREYPSIDVTVRSFTVEQEEVPHAGGTRILREVGRAVIYDHRLGREVTLRSETRKKDDVPTGTFRERESGQEIRAREGDTFMLGRYTYTIDRLAPPASATVSRVSDEEGAEPETRTLIARETGTDRARATGGQTAPDRGGEGPEEDPTGGEAGQFDF